MQFKFKSATIFFPSKHIPGFAHKVLMPLLVFAPPAEFLCLYFVVFFFFLLSSLHPGDQKRWIKQRDVSVQDKAWIIEVASRVNKAESPNLRCWYISVRYDRWNSVQIPRELSISENYYISLWPRGKYGYDPRICPACKTDPSLHRLHHSAEAHS